MWFGVAVIGFIGAIFLALVVATFKIARRRQWVMAATVALPTTAFAYLYLTFMGPPLWIALFGDPYLDALPATAVMVPADELEDLLKNRTHTGRYYKDGAWYVYRETYHQGGRMSGSGGPERNPVQWTRSGRWEIDGENFCRHYRRKSFCRPVYQDGDVYLDTNEQGDVFKTFTVSAPAKKLDPKAEHLTGAKLRFVIEGMAHTGKIIGSENYANFQSTFFGHNHAVYTLRGNDADSLDVTEYGWYRIEDDRLCLAGTLDRKNECFAVYVLDGDYSFVRDDDLVVMISTRPY